jgi:hypothetical protein
MSPPLTHKKALTLGLYLAITAPTEEKAALATEMCDGIASRLTPSEIAQCKRAAMARVARYNRTGVL